MIPPLYMVTGWRGTGKTTFCQKLIDALRPGGWNIRGLLSKAVFEGGTKTAIQAYDLHNGENQMLVNITRRNENDLFLGEWYFNRATLTWGNAVLRACLPCDLLVVDELGPVEFRLHEGWLEAFEVLNTPAYRWGLVVIRPELVEDAQAMFPISQTISIEPGNDLDALAKQWAERITGCAGR